MSDADTPVTDTRVMGVIHTFFRRALRLAGDLVRGVAAGDVARAGVVGGHLRLVHDFLHHHHHAEDEMLWPLMVERVPGVLAPVVRLMEEQHADLYDRLHVALVERMDAEEEQLLPIASRHVSQAEWDAMGEAARAGTPRSQSMLVVGMIVQDGDPEIVAHMLAEAPPPVRWALPKP